MSDQRIETHVLRTRAWVVPLLSYDEELEQERDLVPERSWELATIMPRHKKREPTMTAESAES